MLKHVETRISTEIIPYSMMKPCFPKRDFRTDQQTSRVTPPRALEQLRYTWWLRKDREPACIKDIIRSRTPIFCRDYGCGLAWPGVAEEVLV